MTARGIRNNNPGNIRHSADKWQGMADAQEDADFVTFRSPEFGIRAIARVLLSYKKRGVNTVDAIIRTYAPPSENNTRAYANAVCTATRLRPTEEIDVDTVEIMLPLVRAIIHQETGATYSESVLMSGLRMAGVHDAEPKPLGESRTIRGSVATIGGGALAAASEVARQARDVQDAVQPGLDFMAWVGSYGVWVAVGVTVLAAAAIIWSRYEDHERLGH